MPTRFHRPAVIALFLAAALSAGGCAHRGTSPVPSESDRASLRNVGVAAGTYQPDPSFIVPAKGAGDGALKGGGIGFIAPLAGFGTAGGPYGLAVGAAVGAVLAPVGAVIGAAGAMPSEEYRVSEAALRNALSGLKVHDVLRRRILSEGKRIGTARSLTGTEGGPASPSDNVAYLPLSGKGIDSVLEIRATRLGLRASTWGSDPPMAFFLDVDLRLVRTRDDAVLWTRAQTYGSPPRRFPEWSKDGGRPLREELERACGDVAERTVEEVFILVPLP